MLLVCTLAAFYSWICHGYEKSDVGELQSGDVEFEGPRYRSSLESSVSLESKYMKDAKNYKR